MSRDYYAVLEIDRWKDDQTVTHAYHALTKRYRGSDQRAMRHVEQAYHVLAEPELRSQYDRALLDMVETTPPAEADIIQMLEVSFDIAALGGKVTVDRIAPDGPERVDVTIPRGIDDGALLRIGGLGLRPGPGQHGGDLILLVHIQPHPRLRRDGLDLYLDVTVPVDVAQRGGRVRAGTLEGELELEIPAGTQGGERLLVRRAGLLDDADRRGDLYAVVRLQMTGHEAPPAASSTFTEQPPRRDRTELDELAAALTRRRQRLDVDADEIERRRKVTRNWEKQLTRRQADLDQQAERLNERRHRLAQARIAMRNRLQRQAESQAEVKAPEPDMTPLLEKQRQLDAQAEALRHDQQALDDQKTELAAVEQDLQARRQELDQREQALADEQARLAEQRERFDRQRDDLQREQTEHAEAVRELDTRRVEIDREAESLRQQADELTVDQQHVRDDREAFAQSRAAFDQRSRQLDDDRKQLDARQAELDAYGEQLDRRAAVLESQSRQLEHREQTFETRQQQLDEQRAEHAASESEADRRRAAALQSQQRELDQIRQSLDADRRQLADDRAKLTRERAVLEALRQRIKTDDSHLALRRRRLTRMRQLLREQMTELRRERAAFEAQAAAEPEPVEPVTPQPVICTDVNRTRLVRLLPDGQRRPFELVESTTRIGRDAASEIYLGIATVSRRHCTIERRDDGLYLVDGHSTNGTYHNGRPIREALLHEGDSISLGPVHLVVERLDETEESDEAEIVLSDED